MKKPYSVTLRSKEYGIETIQYATGTEAKQALYNIKAHVAQAKDGVTRHVTITKRFTFKG